MSNNQQTMTTGEFSNHTGLSVSAITKMLREGKLSGEKRKGKWAIAHSELQNKKVVDETKSEPAKRNVSPTTTSSKTTAYTVAQFARITYLTEHGVQKWLKTGRLTGSPNPDGSWRVDADNLSRPELNHIVR